ncbi:phage major tail protein, TP901-1 family [Weissella paramesenteroides]|uniref:phage major tail protein, TP901-1 family n=1 Tax=Weissella paramesenteroides TaxID=1249 RepID=UPI003981F50F
MAETFVDNGVEAVTADPTLAKSIWYFLQSIDEPVGSKAILPSHQTDGETDYGGDSIDEQTKFGRIVMPSTNEDSIELTTYVAPGDKSVEIIKQAKHDGKPVKVWRVVVDKRFATEEQDGDTTHQVFPAEFGYGIVDELDVSDGDDLVEADYTLNITGKLVDGTFPLTDEQISALEAVVKFERPGETTGEPGASK